MQSWVSGVPLCSISLVALEDFRFGTFVVQFADGGVDGEAGIPVQEGGERRVQRIGIETAAADLCRCTCRPQQEVLSDVGTLHRVGVGSVPQCLGGRTRRLGISCQGHQPARALRCRELTKEMLRWFEEQEKPKVDPSTWKYLIAHLTIDLISLYHQIINMKILKEQRKLYL